MRRKYPRPRPRVATGGGPVPGRHAPQVLWMQPPSPGPTLATSRPRHAVTEAHVKATHETEGLLDKARAMLGMPRSGPRPAATGQDLRDIARVNAALLPLLGLAMLATVWIGLQAGAVGPIVLWAVASMSVGALAGFLFGIPRSGGAPRQRLAAGAAGKDRPEAAADAAPPASSFRPNTNLEEVSDWLTKILVGLTLVNLGEIQRELRAIATHAAAALRAQPTDAEVSVAHALLVAFAVLGFLCSYLYTRLFLQGAIRRSDDELDRFNAVVLEELTRSSAVTAAAPSPGEPSVPSATERTAAERVARALPEDRPDVALAPLQALGSEYLKARQDLPFSTERTRRMTEIASRMKPFALAAAPYLDRFANSNSPGDRLAAVMILQMQFDPRWIGWLAERLWQEPAFVGYQAASALLSRQAVAGAAERAQICTAVAAAQARVPYAEEKRDKLVERLLANCNAGAAPAPKP